MKYQVTYCGSESGWVSSDQDFGIIEANNPAEACDIVALREVPHDSSDGSARKRFRIYLEAQEIPMTAAEKARQLTKQAEIDAEEARETEAACIEQTGAHKADTDFPNVLLEIESLAKEGCSRYLVRVYHWQDEGPHAFGYSKRIKELLVEQGFKVEDYSHNLKVTW